MIIDTIELPFMFFDLRIVSIHLFTGAGLVLIELVDDQGGIAEHHKALDVELNSDAKTMEIGFIP